MNIRSFITVKERREALEKEKSIELKNIGASLIDTTVASAKNCENMIGYTQVPMGIAGPLIIEGKEYYIPLATTEGALVASVSRGCKAISESKGARVRSHVAGTTRGPVFYVENLSKSAEFYQFIISHIEELRAIAMTTSTHLQLLSVSSDGVGKYRFVRFSYDTQDAMGMNMVTIATDVLCKYIEKETGARCIAVAGNFDIDKKPAWINSILHRGHMVWAEATIPSDTLTTVLKTTANAVYDVWLAKCMIGSAMAGSMGFNAQYANIIAAIFLATGQDIAHVVEGSIGITTCEVVNDDLYISIYLPDCMVGTVGGGTGLATQKEALSIMGVTTSQAFAEVVAGAVLAGEISLLSSLAQGSLAKAHQRLARGKNS